MNVEEHKLEVVLPPNAFRLVRFLANSLRITADEMAARIICRALLEYTEEIKTEAGIDVNKLLEKTWGREE